MKKNYKIKFYTFIIITFFILSCFPGCNITKSELNDIERGIGESFENQSYILTVSNPREVVSKLQGKFNVVDIEAIAKKDCEIKFDVDRVLVNGSPWSTVFSITGMEDKFRILSKSDTYRMQSGLKVKGQAIFPPVKNKTDETEDIEKVRIKVNDDLRVSFKLI